MESVNGKVYTLWGQFVDKKSEWIGGNLQDEGGECLQTEITDITLKPNGADSAFFTVQGKEYDCGFDVRCGGIGGGQPNDKDTLRLSGYGSCTFTIERKKL